MTPKRESNMTMSNDQRALKIAMQAQELRNLNKAVERLSCRNQILRQTMSDVRFSLAKLLGMVRDSKTDRQQQHTIERLEDWLDNYLGQSGEYLIKRAKRQVEAAQPTIGEVPTPKAGE
jgi:hypothetical protein